MVNSSEEYAIERESKLYNTNMQSDPKDPERKNNNQPKLDFDSRIEAATQKKEMRKNSFQSR